MKVYSPIQTVIGVMVVENSRVLVPTSTNITCTSDELHVRYNITIVSEAEVNNKEGHNEQI